MILYAITDRRSLEGELLQSVEKYFQAGVDYLQIREKDLTDRALFELTRSVMALPNPAGTKVLVNERTDIALAAGAAGVHLPSDSLGPGDVRKIAPPGFAVAVSTHTLEEVREAERAGADFAVFGPVFAPASKAAWGPPQGLGALQSARRAVSMPLLALGGVTIDNAAACVEQGAAGIAAISLFQRETDLERIAAQLRRAESPMDHRHGPQRETR